MNERKDENRTRKPAVNILNLTDGKNEKTRRGGTLHEKLRLDLCFLTGNIE